MRVALTGDDVDVGAKVSTLWRMQMLEFVVRNAVVGVADDVVAVRVRAFVAARNAVEVVMWVVIAVN